jgi:hypothetical protein
MSTRLKATNAPRYLFVSTGPYYVPRAHRTSMAPEQMKGATFNAGRNERKRQRRAYLRLLRRSRLPASLMARVTS